MQLPSPTKDVKTLRNTGTTIVIFVSSTIILEMNLKAVVKYFDNRTEVWIESEFDHKLWLYLFQYKIEGHKIHLPRDMFDNYDVITEDNRTEKC